MRIGTKSNLSDFECDIVVSARWTGLIISESDDSNQLNSNLFI